MDIKEFKKIYKYNSGEQNYGQNFPGIKYYWGEDKNAEFNQCIYKGDEIIESGFKRADKVCDGKFIIYFYKDSTFRDVVTIINKFGEKIFDKVSDFVCRGFLVPGQGENAAPTHFLIKVGKHRDGKVYKVVGDNVELLKFGGLEAYDFTSVNEQEYCALIMLPKEQFSSYEVIIGENYERIPDNYIFDGSLVGPYIGSIRMIKNKPKREEVIIDYKSGKCFPDRPGEIYVPRNTCITGYTYLFTKFSVDSETVAKAYHLDYNNYELVEIGKDYLFCDVEEDPDYSLYVMKAKDDKKYYIINGLELLICDDYRMSGEEQNESRMLVENNFIYYEVDGKWRMTQVKRYNDRGTSKPVYDGEFDAVYYIGSSVNVLRKGDKEHFVSDYIGYFPKDKDGTSYWFDECYPYNGEDETSEKDFAKFIVRNGDNKYVIYNNGSLQPYYD